MIKEIKVIKDGYNGVVEVLENAIAEIETAQNAEIESAITEIKSKYEARLIDYKADLERYVHIETIEVPDEEQSIEGSEFVEEQVVVEG